MKKVFMLLCMTLLFNINIYASYDVQFNNYDFSNSSIENKGEEAIKFINSYREQLQIDLLVENEKLSTIAGEQSKYMDENDSFSTEQDQNSKLFTGIYPKDRALYNKYLNPYVLEFIEKDRNTYKDALINLIDNPYNRINWLNPLYVEVGMGSYNNKYAFELGGSEIKESFIVTYPLNNQKNVPYYWKDNIDPSPYRFYKNTNSIKSPVISFSCFMPRQVSSIIPKKITLINKDKNQNVDININTPRKDEYLNYSVMILPDKYLIKNTEYEVYVNLDFVFEDGRIKPIKHRWSFTTSNIVNPNIINKVELENNVNRQQLLELIFQELNIKTSEDKINKFSDVNSDSNYAKYINNAYSLGLINGYSENTFGPKNYVSREQLIVILMRVYDYLLDRSYITQTVYDEDIFKDINDSGNWSRKAIEVAKDIELINGKGNNMFYPKKFTTRDEALLVINRLNKYISLRK